MLKNRYALLLVNLFFLIFNSQVWAQENYRVTVQAGYHVINSDDVSVSNNGGNKAWVIGAGISSRRMINNAPLDFNLSLTQGRVEVNDGQNRFGLISNKTNLRYSSLVIEAIRVFELTDIVEVAAGPNLVPQYRTIIYDIENISPGDDRLLSFGMGLSGKISLVETAPQNRNSRIVLSLAARWTNFFIHNARNRQIDGFRYNHLVLSPQLSIQF